MPKRSTTSALRYTLRVRDLVHGYVYLSDLERRVINHPLFQRLRHIRQNDVASFVYPSLNISRFEHSIGCSFVAGKMAGTLTQDEYWPTYQKQLRLGPKEFEQICRLYALLHDVGHLPLSHLFEMAFEHYSEKAFPNREMKLICREWFGASFDKLHEACTAAVVKTILSDVPVESSIKEAVLHLTHNKVLKPTDPLIPIKLLVDSEVDADRIDSTARDGLLAGGEYGTHNIERLCSAVRLQRQNRSWGLVYSDKALSSIEALLFDRYRTYTWIHFHHRIVAIKVAVVELIGKLFHAGLVNKDSFPVSKPEVMALRDDIWLWSLLRNWEPNDEVAQAARSAILFRDKIVTPLWKNRMQYRTLHREAFRAAGLCPQTEYRLPPFDRKYQNFINDRVDLHARVLSLKFQPVGKNDKLVLDTDHNTVLGLLDCSELLGHLQRIWFGEPQYHVILLRGCSDIRKIRSAWIKATAEWFRINVK